MARGALASVGRVALPPLRLRNAAAWRLPLCQVRFGRERLEFAVHGGFPFRPSYLAKLFQQSMIPPHLEQASALFLQPCRAVAAAIECDLPLPFDVLLIAGERAQIRSINRT